MNRDWQKDMDRFSNQYNEAASQLEKLCVLYEAEKERADRLEKAIKEALEWTWGCGPQNVGEIESILRKAIVGKGDSIC